MESFQFTIRSTSVSSSKHTDSSVIQQKNSVRTRHGSMNWKYRRKKNRQGLCSHGSFILIKMVNQYNNFINWKGYKENDTEWCGSKKTARLCLHVELGGEHLGPGFEERLCKNVISKWKQMGKKKPATRRLGDGDVIS